MEQQQHQPQLPPTNILQLTNLNSQPQPQQPPPPDGGYGWIVVLSSFLIHFVILGGLYSYGVYQSEYVTLYKDKASAATLAMVGTMGLGLLAALGLFAGRLAEAIGFRLLVTIGAVFFVAGLALASLATEVWHLFLTQGLLCGIGSALCFVPAVSVPSQWFDRKRGMATGIAVCGSGVGGLIISLVTSTMIETVGHQNSLLYTAIFSAVVLFISILLLKTRLPPRKDATGQRMHRPIVDITLFKNKLFRLMFLNGITTTFGYLVPFVLLPSYARFIGLSLKDGALLVGLLNGASAVGRIALGSVGDRLGNLATLTCALGCAGLSILLIWPFARSFGSLLAFALVYGTSAGGFISLLPVVTAELFGVTTLASTAGLIYSAGSFGNFLGSPVANWIIGSTADESGKPTSYLEGILFSGVLVFSGSMILLYILFLAKRDQTVKAPKIVIEKAEEV